MKKKLFAITAICLSMAMSLPMVACEDKNEKGASKATMIEFMQMVGKGYNTYNENHKSYDEFEDLTVHYTTESFERYESIFDYLPEGSDEPVLVVRCDKIEESVDLTINVKNIGEDLFVRIDMVKTDNNYYWNDAFESTTSLTKTTSSYILGVDDDVYYCKATRLVENQYSITGEEHEIKQNTKEYMLFDTREDYIYAVEEVIDYIEELMMRETYWFVDWIDSQTIMQYGPFIDFSKKGDTYIMDVDATLPYIDAAYMGAYLEGISGSFIAGEEGIHKATWFSVNDYGENSGVENNGEVSFEYSSSLQSEKFDTNGYNQEDMINLYIYVYS